MDSLDDCAPLVCQIFESLHNTRGCERIKTSCRLIQEDKTGVSNELDSNRCSLALTTWDSFNEWTSDLCALAFSETELTKDLVNSLDFLLDCAWKLQLGRELKTLPDGESLEKNIILLYVSTVGAEALDVVSINTIYEDSSLFLKLSWDQSSR